MNTFFPSTIAGIFCAFLFSCNSAAQKTGNTGPQAITMAVKAGDGEPISKESAQAILNAALSAKAATVPVFSRVEINHLPSDYYPQELREVEKLGYWKTAEDKNRKGTVYAITEITAKGAPLIHERNRRTYDDGVYILYDVTVGKYEANIEAIGEPILNSRGFKTCHVNYTYGVMPNEIGKWFSHPNTVFRSGEAVFVKENGQWVLDAYAN